MKKVEELVKSLTLEEKASLCQGASFWYTKEIEEKEIPGIMMTDGPHGLRKQTGETDHLGVNKSVPATCFPSAAAIANSWDRDLIREIGEALGEECLQEEVSVLLGPGANIKRSPLCGRNFEYFSEDPYLSAQMAKSHILGVQSKGVGTSLKHFAMNNQETRRMTVNVSTDERTLREIYLASFEAAVREAKPWTIMGAYNKINGEYCCENHHLLREILREEWGYEGVVVSDWGAANDQVRGMEEGFDLRMPYAGEAYTGELVQAVKEGRLSEKRLDETVTRILTMVEKGLENKKAGYTYDAEAHHRLAVRAGAESAVLLKNEGGVLPLRKEEKIALIGGFAKSIRYQGGGSSHVIPTFHRELLQVLEEDYPEIRFTFSRGYRLKKDVVDENYVAEALAAAQEADKAVVLIGLPDGWESEGFDRRHLRIPFNQIDLLERLAETGKPVIAFLLAGAPVETPWIHKVDALFAMYTDGQGVAEAMAQLLYGVSNPCGKLAETWPMELAHTPCSLTWPQRETAVYGEGIFVGYRYYDKKTLPVRFPFGHGLSYTRWEYSDLKLDRESALDTDPVIVSLRVRNVGDREGSETVQLYVRDVESSVPRPEKELKGFVKVFCRPGEAKTVTFRLDQRSFAFYHEGMRDWYAEDGEYEILVGASSRDIREKAGIQIKSTSRWRKQYDAFVTMGELMELPGAQPILAGMMSSYQMPEGPSEEEREKILEDEDSVEEIAMDYGAMGMDMPLIKVAAMSQGAMGQEQIAGILAMINQQGGEKE